MACTSKMGRGLAASIQSKTWRLEIQDGRSIRIRKGHGEQSLWKRLEELWIVANSVSGMIIIKLKKSVLVLYAGFLYYFTFGCLYCQFSLSFISLWIHNKKDRTVI